MKRRPLLTSCLTVLLGILLSNVFQNELDATEMLGPEVTANVQLTGGVFMLTATNPGTLLTQQDLSSNIDNRSILEFSLDSLTSSTAIILATLELEVTFRNPNAVISIFGYAGDGEADVNDAAVTANFLGASDPITALGLLSVDLDVDVITDLVGSSTHLGLLLMGDAGGLSADFVGDPNSDFAPMLNITFAPIPGDFDLNRVVDGFDFLKWQRGEVSSPPSADDLLDWQNNYGTTASLAAITSVPEPTTLCFVLLGALGLLANRQTCGYSSSRLTP